MMGGFPCMSVTLFALLNAALIGALGGLMIGFVLGAWSPRPVEKIDSEEI